MRHIILSVAALVSPTVAYYYRDPRTTTECVFWGEVDNAAETSCESFLRFWTLEPERFHNWNPSVGLDCKPWHDERSYCVQTNATIWDAVNGTTWTTDVGYETLTFTLPSLTTDKDGWTIPVTRSDAPARTTSSRAPVPSPATWKDKGCFVDTFKEDYNLPPSEWAWILDFRFVPTVADETLETCKQKCWEMAYPVAGVKGGNECFCGDRNNGTLAEDQGACDMPCVGDASVICGGRNHTSVWEAEAYIQSTAAAATGTGSTAGAGSGAGAGSASRTDASGATATASSGARRNVGMFWRM